LSSKETPCAQDNEWIRKEIQWRADIAERQAAEARKAAGR
jgi:hypothetical protein